MDTKQVLIDARALITDPDRHCQNHYAIDALGLDVPPTSVNACAWCLYGALAKSLDVNGVDTLRSFWSLIGLIVKELVPQCEVRVSGMGLNDGKIILPGRTPHQAVLEVLDIAITRV